MFDEVRTQLGSPDGQIAAQASLSFAKRVWKGEVDDETLTRLLSDKSESVRAKVAWAIADAHVPPIGVQWLITHGLEDPSDAVRFWAIQCLIDADSDTALANAARVKAMLSDPSERVKRNARAFLNKVRHPLPDN